MTVSKYLNFLVAGALCLSISAPALAQDMLSGTAAIEKRQELMKSAGGTLRGAGSATGDEAIAAGETLVDNFTQLQDLWPEDSQQGAGTKALPAIWANKDDFDAKLDDALTKAEAVLAAALEGDMSAYGDAVKMMGQTCGGCHTVYRGK